MAIWLGTGGGMRLDRLASEQVYAYIVPADVDAGERRFGLDKAKSCFITGDLVWIKRVDENGQPVDALLDFVSASGWPDGQQHSDGQWYVNVDAIGGMRLYRDWRTALEGGATNAIELVEPSESYRISLQTQVTDGERCLAQTVSWELNTNREVADISSLGDGFRQNMAVMVSGSGSLDCLFDALPDACGDDMDYERSVYLHQLVLRQEIGATFTGVFLLKRSGTLPITVEEQYRPRELFYLCDCVITQVASEVNTEDIIHSKIDFVTTGEIKLLYSQPLSYLLQEQPPMDRVLQESDFGIVLETVD
jgi:hypothetical protein